jgi:general secretion pathway protein G
MLRPSSDSSSTGLAPHRRWGFSLPEALLVVTILIVLAVAIVPYLQTAKLSTEQQILQQDLQMLRSQLQLYKFQHAGRYPGHGSTDPQVMVQQLTRATNEAGDWAPLGTVGYPFGPYVLGTFPRNPYNGSNTVQYRPARFDLETKPASPVGWWYDPATGRLDPAVDEAHAATGGASHEGVQRVQHSDPSDR